MPKKYRLKYAIGAAKTGSVGTLNIRGNHYYFEVDGLNEDLWFPREYVEDNPRTFEEIKEKERIEVTAFYFQRENDWWGRKDVKYICATDKRIPDEKYDQIKSALSSILNDEPIEEQKTNSLKDGYVKVGEWTKEDEELVAKIVKNPVYTGSHYAENQPLTGELITLEECERREKEVFDWVLEEMQEYHYQSKYPLPTFEGYETYKFLKSKQTK